MLMRCISKLSFIFQSYFGLSVLLVGILACTLPISFHTILPVVPLLLGIIMLGIGLTLRSQDFSELFKNPRLIILGIIAKYMVMPLLGFGLATLFHLPPELSVGLILVGCCPGGTASNLMTFLAGGDVALTVALTSLTTLIAPVTTPLLLYFLAKHWISIAPEKMFISILQIVIIPIILGLFIRRFMPQVAQKTVPFLPLISILLILLIIATVINVNASIILRANAWLFLSVMLHNIGGLASGHLLGGILKVNSKQRSALTFEIGMQDSGLGVALAVAYLGPIYALPSAIFSVWQNISGPVLTTYFAKQLKRPVGSSTESLMLEISN